MFSQMLRCNTIIQAIILLCATAAADARVSTAAEALPISSAHSGGRAPGWAAMEEIDDVSKEMLLTAAAVWAAHWWARSERRAVVWSRREGGVGAEEVALGSRMSFRCDSSGGTAGKPCSVAPWTLVKGSYLATGALSFPGSAAASVRNGWSGG